MKRRTIAAGVAALAVVGGGTAVAASGLGTPQQESKAVIDDAAKQLGVSSAKLSDALKQAYENRIDAAVAAGRITKAQGEALKQQIESQDYPLLGPGFGHHGPGGPGGHGFPHLDAAAAYLGLSATELQTQLQSGKTLADIAKAQGKTVDGLVTALVADEKKELDAAVAAGRLTQAQADQLLAGAKQRFTDLANGTMPEGGRPHGFFGPPPTGTQDDASFQDGSL
jgi:peptidoglycan hydrolase CwlO-like protein